MFFTKERIRQICHTHETSAAKGAMEALQAEAQGMDSAWWQERKSTLLRLKARTRETDRPGPVMRHGSMLRTTALNLLQICFVQACKGGTLQPYQTEMFEFICANSWCVQGNFDGWKSDLWTADIGMYLSCVYELLQDELSEEKKDSYRKFLYEKSFCPIYEEWVSPESHEHCLDTMGHNWWSVCVSAAGIVLLLQDPAAIEGYDEKLGNVLHALNAWFGYAGNCFLNKRPNFGPDGDYLEYLGYLSYALENLSVLQCVLESRGMGTRLQADAYLEKLPDFILQNIVWENGTPAGANLGDSGLRNTCMSALIYLCKRYKRGDLLGILQQIRPCPATVFELAHYPDAKMPTEIRLPQLALYRLSGQAVLRTGHTKQDMVLVVKTGDSWNHNHLDSGTFELCNHGVKYITDSGRCSYLNPLYRGYYIQPKAHSVVLLDGEGEWAKTNYEGTKFPGGFPASLCEPEYRYVLADCTGAYAPLYQRFYRSFFMLDEFVFLIDDVQTYRDGVLESRFHTSEESMQLNGTQITIQNPVGNGHILFPFAKNGDVSVETAYRQALPENEQGEEISPTGHCAVCKTTTDQLRAKLFTLIDVSGSAGAPSIKASFANNVYDIEICRANKTHRFLVNVLADGRVMHRNAKITYQNITTDAFITYFCYDANRRLQSFAVHNGSLLKIGNACMFTSFIKETCFKKLQNQQEP
ncbi:MAG: heparinase II/III family protein [Gemmiger sp.]|nr:heparinase II/III family protein [Gemmiger sp.]